MLFIDVLFARFSMLLRRRLTPAVTMLLRFSRR